MFEAADYSAKTDTQAGRFLELPEYGRTGSGMKAFPVNRTFSEQEGPSLRYDFSVPEASAYIVTIYMSPSNPPFMNQKLLYGFSVNQGPLQICNAVPEGYRVGDGLDSWQNGVLENIRINQITINCKKGQNCITLQAMSPAFVLQKIVVSRKDSPLAASYLGPVRDDV